MKNKKFLIFSVVIACLLSLGILCAFTMPLSAVSAENTDRFTIERKGLPVELSSNENIIPKGFYDSFTDQPLPQEINASNILSVIPEELIANSGSFIYTGKKYGFFVNTVGASSFSGYTSDVMVFTFETEKKVSSQLNDAAFYVYAKIALNAKIFTQATNSQLRKDIQGDFALQDVKINTFLYNVNQLNDWDDDYKKSEDEGYYFTAASLIMQSEKIESVNDPYEVLASEIMTLLGFVPVLGDVVSMVTTTADVAGVLTGQYELTESNSYSVDFVNANEYTFRRNLLFSLSEASAKNNLLHSDDSYMKAQVVLNKQSAQSVAEMITKVSFNVVQKIGTIYNHVTNGEYETHDFFGEPTVAGAGDAAYSESEVVAEKPLTGVIAKNKKNVFAFTPTVSGNYKVETDTDIALSVNEAISSRVDLNATKGMPLNVRVFAVNGDEIEKTANGYMLKKGERYRIEIENAGENMREGCYNLKVYIPEIAIDDTAQLVDLTRVDLASFGFSREGIGYRCGSTIGKKLTAPAGVTLTLYRDGAYYAKGLEVLYAVFEAGHSYVLTASANAPQSVSVKASVERARQNVNIESEDHLRVYVLEVSSSGEYIIKTNGDGGRLFGADGEYIVTLNADQKINLTAALTYYLEVPALVSMTVQKAIPLGQTVAVNYLDANGTYGLFLPQIDFEYSIVSENGTVAFLDENFQTLSGGVLEAGRTYYINLPMGSYSLKLTLSEAVAALKLNEAVSGGSGYYKFIPEVGGVYTFVTQNAKVYRSNAQSVAPVTYADGFALTAGETYFIKGNEEVLAVYGRLTFDTILQEEQANGTYSYYNDSDASKAIVLKNPAQNPLSGHIEITVNGVSKTFEFNDNSQYLASAFVAAGESAVIKISAFAGGAIVFAPQPNVTLAYGESDVYIDKDALPHITFFVPAAGKFAFAAAGAPVSITVDGENANGYVSLSQGVHAVNIQSELNGQNITISVSLQTQTLNALFNEITQNEKSGWYAFDASKFNSLYGAAGYSVYSDAQKAAIYNENLIELPFADGIVFESKLYFVNLILAGESGKTNFNLTADYDGITSSETSGRSAVADQNGDPLIGVEKVFSLHLQRGLFTLNVTKEDGSYLSDYTLRFYDKNGLSVTVSNISPTAPYFTFFANETAAYAYAGITVNEKAYVSLDDETINIALFEQSDMRHFLKYAVSLNETREIFFAMPAGNSITLYSPQSGAKSLSAGESVTFTANVTYYIYDKTAKAVGGYSFALIPSSGGELTLSQKRYYAVNEGITYYTFTPALSDLYYVNIAGLKGVYRASNGNVSEIIDGSVNLVQGERYYFEIQSSRSGSFNLQLVKAVKNVYLERDGVRYGATIDAAAGDVFKAVTQENGIFKEIDFDYYNLSVSGSHAYNSGNKIRISDAFLSGSFTIALAVANVNLSVTVNANNEIANIEFELSGSNRYSVTQNDVAVYTLEAYERFVLTPVAYNRNGVRLSKNFSFTHIADESSLNEIWKKRNDVFEYVKASGNSLKLYFTDALLEEESYVMEARALGKSKKFVLKKRDAVNFDTVYDLRNGFASSYTVNGRKVRFIFASDGIQEVSNCNVTVNDSVEYIEFKGNGNALIFGMSFHFKGGSPVHIRSISVTLSGATGTGKQTGGTLFNLKERSVANFYLYHSFLMGGKGATGEQGGIAIDTQKALNFFVPKGYTGSVVGGLGGNGSDGISLAKERDYSPSTYGNGRNGNNGANGGNSEIGAGNGNYAVRCRELCCCYEGRLVLQGGSGGRGGNGGKGQDGQNGQTGASGPGLITSGGRGGNGGNGGNGSNGGNGEAPIKYLTGDYKGKRYYSSPYDLYLGGMGGFPGEGGDVGRGGHGGYSNAAWGITGQNGSDGRYRGSSGHHGKDYVFPEGKFYFDDEGKENEKN